MMKDRGGVVMATSLLMASSFFVGRVRRLSKGWSFAATQSSGDSAYPPKCVERLFCEGRIPDPGRRDPETVPNDLTARREAYESTLHLVRPHKHASLCTPDTPERDQVLGSRNQRAVPRFLAPVAHEAEADREE